MNLLLPAAAAVGGAIVGSFLATLIIRWPRGVQVVFGRSRCDSCGRELSAVELLPVISWIATRGRCKSCRAAIPKAHLWIELAAAALGASAVALQPNLDGAALAVFWILLLAPAVLDARHYWLPDSLTIVVALAGLLLGEYATGASLIERLIGGAAGFAGLWLVGALYRSLRHRYGLGAGDPKLFGAIGLWAGWQSLPPILLIAALSGLAVALLQGRSRLDRMPFGTLLAVGAMLWTAFDAAGAQLV